MKAELANIPVIKKARLIKPIEDLIRIEYAELSSNTGALYQGYLGNIADELVPFCPDVSNVLRNRLLVFRASPQLVQNN